MSAFKKQYEMLKGIMDGKLSKGDVETAIESISKEYGDDVFTPYSIEKKEKPWSYNDLKELYDMAIVGISSKDLYLYMAEIGDYLKLQKRKKVIIISAIVGLVIATIAIIAIILLNTNWKA